MSAPSPDPHELLLCQVPGLTAPQVVQLVAEWDTAEGVLRASGTALRASGLGPAVVAKLLAAPRQLASVAAGLKGLTRLGITPVPLASSAYPTRLRDLASPPLVLYVQGAWPLPTPLVAIIGLPDDALQDQAQSWLEQWASWGLSVGVSDSALAFAPSRGTLAVVPYGLLLARQRLPEALRLAAHDQTATVLSAAAVNLPPDDRARVLADAVLLACADAQVVLDTTLTAPPTLPTFVVVWPHTDNQPPTSKKQRLTLDARGLRRLARALGLQATAQGVVQQERLW